MKEDNFEYSYSEYDEDFVNDFLLNWKNIKKASHFFYELQENNYDSLKIYLHKAWQYPLLSKEEEKKYGLALKEGRNLSILKNVPLKLDFESNSKEKYTKIINLNILFVTCLNSPFRDDILKLLDGYYESKEGNKSKKIKYYLEKYQELLKENNNPTINDLNKFFKNNNKYQYLEKFKKEDILDSKELLKDVDIYVKSLIARDKLYTSYLKFVVLNAKRYCNLGMDILDLIEEGNMVLESALERFDVSKGYRFSTFSFWLLRRVMMRSIYNKSDVIRHPVYVMELLNKYDFKKDELAQKIGHMPSKKEIADYLKIDINEVYHMESLLQEVLSLDSKDDNFNRLEDSIIDPNNLVEEKALEEQGRKELFEFLSKHLRERDLEIIKLYYGFYGDPYTYEEIANIYGISASAVRQAITRSFEKLKSEENIKRIRKIMQ